MSCVHDGQNVPDGAWICKDGYWHVCRNGHLRKTRFPCDDDCDGQVCTIDDLLEDDA